MSTRILSVDSLTVSFNGFTVLDGLDFHMDFGELRFLIDPNGAGKSTLLDTITGKTKPTSGSVFCEVDVAKLQEHEIVRVGIGRKFQTPSVFGSLSVFENLEAAEGFNSGFMSLFKRLRKEHSTDS